MLFTAMRPHAAHNITVGGLDIDSGWSTGYNNFIIDTNKFANMTQLVNQMHAQGVNVVRMRWMVQPAFLCRAAGTTCPCPLARSPCLPFFVPSACLLPVSLVCRSCG